MRYAVQQAHHDGSPDSSSSIFSGSCDAGEIRHSLKGLQANRQVLSHRAGGGARSSEGFFVITCFHDRRSEAALPFTATQCLLFIHALL